MNNLLKRNFARFRLQEQLYATEEFQKLLAREGLIPNIDKLLLRKYKIFMQYLGGLLLALLISVISLLINFIFFNMIIHIGS